MAESKYPGRWPKLTPGTWSFCAVPAPIQIRPLLIRFYATSPQPPHRLCSPLCCLARIFRETSRGHDEQTLLVHFQTLSELVLGSAENDLCQQTLQPWTFSLPSKKKERIALPMPEKISDTAENVAHVIMNSPPPKDGKWLYEKRNEELAEAEEEEDG